MNEIQSITETLYVIVFMFVIGSFLHLFVIFIYFFYLDDLRNQVKEVGELLRKNSEAINSMISKIEILEKKYFIKRKTLKKHEPQGRQQGADL